MKIGVLKLGASITWSKISKTAANFDIHSLVDILRKYPTMEIDIVTRNTRNTVLPADLNHQEIMTVDINAQGYDFLMVFNGNVNFFGGAEAPDQLMNYVHINKFKGKVVYVHTDGQLQLKQIWPSVAAKPWSIKWNESDLVVTRDDIIYLTQARKPERVYSLCRKPGSVPVKLENIHHFPIEQAILYNLENIRVVQRKKDYDLIYGGSMRGGQRKKLLEKYYFGLMHTSCLFGAVKASMFSSRETSPTFLGKVDHHQFINAMTRGKATCIIGDEWYFDNMHTLRIYESIIAGIVCFVSKEFDPNKTIFKDPVLQDFLYVSSKSELDMKLSQLTREFYNDIICRQFEDIDFDGDSYANRLHASLSKIAGTDRR